jgi:hypothetical protein
MTAQCPGSSVKRGWVKLAKKKQELLIHRTHLGSNQFL